MFKKELELIKNPIYALMQKKLLIGFKDRRGRELHSLENLSIYNIEIDEEKSSLKETVYVSSVLAQARIWLNIPDGRANDNVELALSREVVLEYNFGAKEYVIINEDEIELVNRSY